MNNIYVFVRHLRGWEKQSQKISLLLLFKSWLSRADWGIPVLLSKLYGLIVQPEGHNPLENEKKIRMTDVDVDEVKWLYYATRQFVLLRMNSSNKEIVKITTQFGNQWQQRKHFHQITIYCCAETLLLILLNSKEEYCLQNQVQNALCFSGEHSSGMLWTNFIIKQRRKASRIHMNKC